MNITQIKKVLLLQLALLLSFNLISQEVSLLPNWNLGDTKTYTIKESLQLSAMGELRTNSYGTKEVVITATRKSKKFIELEWTTSNIEYTDSVKSDLPDVGIVTLTEGLVVKYTIGARNDHFELLNFEELKDSIATRLNRNISNLAVSMNLSEDKLSLMRTQFLMMYSTRPAIDAIVLSDIYIYHQLYGRNYNINDPKIFNQRPEDNTFGAPDKIEVTLESISDTTNVFKTKVISPFAERMGWIKSTISSYEFLVDSNWLVNHKSELTLEGESPVVQVYEMQLK